MKRFMSSAISAALLLALTGGIAACTSKVTTTRKFDKDGKQVEETTHQKIQVLPGIKLNPGQVVIPIPGISIDGPDVPPGTQPVTLPDGRPGVTFPDEPGKVFPIETQSVSTTREHGQASYNVEVTINEATMAASATVTLIAGTAPDLMGRGAAWPDLTYQNRGDTDVVSSKIPYLVAGFLHSRGFNDFGDLGRSADMTWRETTSGRVIGIMTVGVTSGDHQRVFPLVVSGGQ